jgi:hypothetical protein
MTLTLRPSSTAVGAVTAVAAPLAVPLLLPLLLLLLALALARVISSVSMSPVKHRACFCNNVYAAQHGAHANNGTRTTS